MLSVKVLGQVRSTVSNGLLDVFGRAEGSCPNAISELCFLELCAQINVWVTDRSRFEGQGGVDTSKH